MTQSNKSYVVAQKPSTTGTLLTRNKRRARRTGPPRSVKKTTRYVNPVVGRIRQKATHWRRSRLEH